MPHYLVTGGAGFIGSNLINELFNKEKDIFISCVDNFDPYYKIELKQLNIRKFANNSRFQLIHCDISKTSPSQLAEKINQPVDVIVHLAAKAGVRPSIEDPLAYQQANVIGTQNLLDFARQQMIKQFVFASSSSVYGINDEFPWNEKAKLVPISPYGMTKQAGEMMGQVYSRLFGIRFIALRFFTVYGPGQRPDLAIHKFTKAILNDQSIPMFGDGNTSRDYTYVDDTVRGIISAMNYEKSDFEIINLGNHYAVSLKELVAAIEETVGKKARIEKLPEQLGDVPKTYADISKAEKLFNYEPKTGLKDGLKKFYNWFMHNRSIV
jgi:UDP-glucuronate 4-epimerase